MNLPKNAWDRPRNSYRRSLCGSSALSQRKATLRQFLSWRWVENPRERTPRFVRSGVHRAAVGVAISAGPLDLAC